MGVTMLQQRFRTIEGEGEHCRVEKEPEHLLRHKITAAMEWHPRIQDPGSRVATSKTCTDLQ